MPGYDAPAEKIPPYQESPGERYMNEKQRAYFRQVLLAWKQELMQEVDRTVQHMQHDATNFPDPNDRATQESEFTIELRARDRERKLIRKIDEALKGPRADPFTGHRAFHRGVDIASPMGSPIFAMADGVVTWAGPRAGYGNMVEINHGQGLSTRYGHASAVTVKVGDVVSRGDEIAKVGSTGRSTGPHVHFEVLRGHHQVDPIGYLERDRVPTRFAHRQPPKATTVAQSPVETPAPAVDNMPVDTDEAVAHSGGPEEAETKKL